MNIVAQDFDRDMVTMSRTIDLSPDVPRVVAANHDLVPDLKTSADLAPLDGETGRVDLYRAQLRETAPLVAARTLTSHRTRRSRGPVAVGAPKR